MSASVDKAVAEIVHVLNPNARTEDIVRIAYLHGRLDGLREAGGLLLPAPLIEAPADPWLKGDPDCHHPGSREHME